MLGAGVGFYDVTVAKGVQIDIESPQPAQMPQHLVGVRTQGPVLRVLNMMKRKRSVAPNVHVVDLDIGFLVIQVVLPGQISNSTKNDFLVIF